jgi:hypothetical protein
VRCTRWFLRLARLLLYFALQKRAKPSVYSYATSGLNDVTSTYRRRSNLRDPIKRGLLMYLDITCGELLMLLLLLLLLPELACAVVVAVLSFVICGGVPFSTLSSSTRPRLGSLLLVVVVVVALLGFSFLL